MNHSYLIIILGVLLSSCAAPQNYSLMPTPVLYVNSSIDPFAHLSQEQKNTLTNVYYATNRTLVSNRDAHSYSNGISSTLRFGLATVRMGDTETGWNMLHESSLSDGLATPIKLSLEKVEEQAETPVEPESDHWPISPELDRFFEMINSELSTALDREIMVYVHGTKVDFTNAAILTAEVDHFAGRDFVGLAFSWPSHQNIISYLLGTDVQRALNSSPALADLLILLARYTKAEKINILAYSAGCRVTSKALSELQDRFATLETQRLKETMKIGAVVFAAADVAVDVFLDRLKAASELADQVVITTSDKDNALQAAQKYMGGKVRAGTSGAEAAEIEYIVAEGLRNVSIVDVSIGQEHRGFDIIGHHYWYRHPWMSSDIVFIMRTDLPPSRRGLQPAVAAGLWYLSSEYPHRVREAVARELGGQW